MDSYITKLPKELLAIIFEHLTKANDRRRIAQVCKLFYEVVRHQSTLKQDNMLRVKGSDSDKSPIRVLENSAFFPFSKLVIVDEHHNVISESAFWALHGEQICEINLFGQKVYTEPILSTLSKLFPNLKKLTIKSMVHAGNISQNISLPIEDLTIEILFLHSDLILDLLRCSHWLKNLKISWNHGAMPQILPWLETIECTRLSFGEVPLEKLINLPSKVVIEKLTIQGNETSESIREFFKRPRTIDELTLRRLSINDNRTALIHFTQDQALALDGADSIKKVNLPGGALEFEGSLDFLATLPGLESISIEFKEDYPNPLDLFYWSSPETAQKIRDVVIKDVSKLHYLAGLSSLTSLSILSCGYPTPRGLSNDDIQFLFRNCPNLKKLSLSKMDATDADLIEDGDLLPIASLEKLETLDIGSAPNITSEAFKSAFKFPNLKNFALQKYPFEEQTFNQDVAKPFTQNCPNLEYLKIWNCPINQEGFDYLIRHLPYLRRIDIQPKGGRHSLNKDQIAKLQKEFPYIKTIDP